MTDIVDRLRDGGVFPMTFGTPDVKDVVILYDPMTPTDAIKEIERLRAALDDAYAFVVVAVNQYRLDFELDRLHDTHADIADRIARLLGKERLPSEVLKK